MSGLHTRCPLGAPSIAPDIDCRSCGLHSKRMFGPLALLDSFNSREDALVFWALVGTGLALSGPDIRHSLLNVIRSVLAPALLRLWILTAVYTTAVVAGAERLGLWHTTTLKETLYWFFGAGVVLIAGAIQTTGDPVKFKNLVRRAFKFTIVLEFFVNVYVFPLAVELFFIPFMVLLVTMNAFSGYQPKYKDVARLTEKLIVWIGFGVVAFVAVSVLRDLDGATSRETIEQLLVAPALTIASIPLFYFVALLTAYEQVFWRTKFFLRDDKRLARRANLAVVRACGFSLRRISLFTGEFIPRLIALRNENDLDELMRDFQAAASRLPDVAELDQMGPMGSMGG